MGRFAASNLGLFCLPMSHRKDARLIWVKNELYMDIHYADYLFYFLLVSCRRVWQDADNARELTTYEMRRVFTS